MNDRVHAAALPARDPPAPASSFSRPRPFPSPTRATSPEVPRRGGWAGHELADIRVSARAARPPTAHPGAVVQMKRKHASKYVTQHGLDVKARHEHIMAYVNDPRNPQEHREGLMAAWNQNQSAHFRIRPSSGSDDEAATSQPLMVQTQEPPSLLTSSHEPRLQEPEEERKMPSVASSSEDLSGGEEEEEEDDEPVGSKAAAVAHLAGKLGMDPDHLGRLMGSMTEGLQHFSKKDLNADFDDWSKTITGLEHQDKRAGTPSGGSGGGSGEWASKAVRASAKQHVAAAKTGEKGAELFKGDKYTIHHKISRSNLRSLYAQMTDPTNAKAAAPLEQALDTIGQDVGAKSRMKILLNMPANLEVGPSTERRTDDPGSGFDPNVPLSPRSGRLAAADSEISSSSPDFGKLAKIFLDAHHTHLGMAKGEVLTPPQLDQWKKAKGDKYKRQ